MNNRETMWAEVKVDCYGGEQCMNHRHTFEGYAEGDMDSDITDTIDFDASTFPPGTKISVMEPECPECGEIPYRSFEKQHVDTDDDGVKIYDYTWECCGDFNWRKFAEEEYS